MAGKKGNKKGRDASKGVSDPASVAEASGVNESQEVGDDIADAPAADVETSSSDVQPSHLPDAGPTTTAQPEHVASSAPHTADPSGEPIASEQQLQRLAEQLQAKDALLAEKDEEIRRLREQLASRPAAGAPAVPLAAQRTNDDMKRLQERLQQLRRDQADADSAREAAWRQLKTVVADINRLAQHDTNAKAAAVAAN